MAESVDSTNEVTLANIKDNQDQDVKEEEKLDKKESMG